ncbi:MAG TPA: hypothetical protein PLF24_05535 [Ruminococcus sp.]|nr:hypothetical protein [Ruminococcus sp.]
MIKGVNKRIIEINNPQSIYFEKAIFYLKPNVSQLPDSIAQSEVQRYISLIGLETDYENKRKAFLRKTFVYSSIAAILAGILIAVIVSFR